MSSKLACGASTNDEGSTNEDNDESISAKKVHNLN